MLPSRPGPLALMLAATIGGASVLTVPAAARADDPGAERDLRRGIRAAARHVGHGATPSRMRITCTEIVTADSDRSECTGSFRLTLRGRTARYVLTKGAGIHHGSATYDSYSVFARATRSARGLPSRIRFAGFLQ